jgi:type II secretory pathway component PulF
MFELSLVWRDVNDELLRLAHLLQPLSLLVVAALVALVIALFRVFGSDKSER